MTKPPLLERPVVELATAVASGQLTAEALVQASLDKIEATADYHTVLTVDPEALDLAKAIDRRIAAGETVGPLAGVPFIAKDNFLTAGVTTTAASHMLEPFVPPNTAVAVERLTAAGAVLVAKANLDAYAHGSSTENSDFGPTKNPHDPDYVPGGSSGGSAAAVALGQASFALGTDTGGSVRQPASYCGVIGLKPTYGLIPRTGVVAMSSSSDVIGPLARTVSDAAVVLDVLAGRDESDATSIDRVDSYRLNDRPIDLTGRRIGLISEYLEAGVEAQVSEAISAAVEKLRQAGATVTPISLPSTELALAAYYILVPAEVSSNLARYDGIKYGYSSKGATTLEETYRRSRGEGFGAEAKRRILIGTYVLSSGYYDAYYKRAQRVRTKLIAEFAAAFERVELLIGPTTPTAAFKLGAKTADPLAMYQSDVCTVAVNLVGVPAISVPLGRVGRRPFGLQLIAPQRADRSLLEAAAAVEGVLS